MDILQKIIRELIRRRIKTQNGLQSFKNYVAKKYKIPYLRNSQLLKVYHEMMKNKTFCSVMTQGVKESINLERLLLTRPVRSLSGIVNVSVLTKPYPCPGKCLYCPLEIGVPKSYLSGEPAVDRAKMLNFDPYLQVKKRIEMLDGEGHPTDKIDLRIIGGTWSYYKKQYQSWFIKRCFQACDDFDRSQKSKTKNRGSKSQFNLQSLSGLQKMNESASHRLIGISVETRPDFINEKELERMRMLGITRVEIGVQSIYDDVLGINRRGHGAKEIISATKLLKDAGFKICYQIMPNLAGSNLRRDKEMFRELFENPNFQPDYLKIYPCAVLKEAALYSLWKKGGYIPYPQRQLINLIKEIKKWIPYYVRIQRITRDIPSQLIVAGGAKISNTRQIVAQEMQNEKSQCKCIRCREVKGQYNPNTKLYFYRGDYKASDGYEIFLSFEDKNRQQLYSLLRLRVPSQYLEGRKHFLAALNNAAIIREMQTFGPAVRIGAIDSAPQHRSLGRKLLEKAEEIIRAEFCANRDGQPIINKIAVIAGVGVRGYFRRLGYELENSYMTKRIA